MWVAPPQPTRPAARCVTSVNNVEVASLSVLFRNEQTKYRLIVFVVKHNFAAFVIPKTVLRLYSMCCLLLRIAWLDSQVLA